MCDTVTCIHCKDVMGAGETYYTVPWLGVFCEDCFDALVKSMKHTVGEVVDRI